MRKAPTASFRRRTVEAQRRSGTQQVRGGPGNGPRRPRTQAFPTGSFVPPHPPTSEPIFLRNTHSASGWAPTTRLGRQWGTWEEPAREPPALNTGKAPPRLYHVPADGCWGRFCSSFKAAEHIRAPWLLCTRGSSVQDKCLHSAGA